VARVVAFIPDLLFGSNVLAALSGAGHEVELVSEPAASGKPDVLIVDLTAEPARRIELVRAMPRPNVRTLAFYSHIEADVRAQAEDAGFDMVVPRSRMAREAPSLVDRLLAASG